MEGNFGGEGMSLELTLAVAKKANSGIPERLYYYYDTGKWTA